MIEAPSKTDTSFARGKIAASGVTLFVGAPRNDDKGKVYIFNNKEMVGGLTLLRGSQTYGNIFGLSGDTAVVIAPHRPGEPSGQGGTGPSKTLSPASIDLYKRSGTEWKLAGNTETNEMNIGDEGVVIDKDFVAISSSGVNEKYPNTCINVYKISGNDVRLVKTFYPKTKTWGPLNNAYRFSGFDYRDNVCIGLWNDGLNGYKLSDKGPLRVWGNVDPDSEPVLIENKQLTQAKIVNKDLIVGVTLGSLITYVRSSSSWTKGMTINTGKFVKNAIAVSDDGTKVAVRTFLQDSAVIMVFDVNGTTLSLKKGMHFQSPYPVSAGFAITNSEVFTGVPSFTGSKIMSRKISSLPLARYNASSGLVVEAEKDPGDGDGTTPPGGDGTTPPGGGGITPPSVVTEPASNTLLIAFLVVLLLCILAGVYWYTHWSK